MLAQVKLVLGGGGEGLKKKAKYFGVVSLSLFQAAPNLGVFLNKA